MELLISTSLSNFNFVLKTSEGINHVMENLSIIESDPIDVISNKLVKIQKPINDLKGIFIDVGPGGTSSIRTGVSIANALSYALNIPSYPVASCELIHSFVSEKEPNTKWIILYRAIKGHVFYYRNKGATDYRRNITYGLLSELLPEILQSTDGEIGIITDFKTERDIKNQIILEDRIKFYPNYFQVNINHFAKICDQFSDRAIYFPNIIIPITENQIIDV
jgi:tRNA A37 threonylcarbamoyladenosine modification protein TsaB